MKMIGSICPTTCLDAISLDISVHLLQASSKRLPISPYRGRNPELTVKVASVIMDLHSRAPVFTSKHPYIHDYNPLTHIRKNSSVVHPTLTAPLESSASASYKPIQTSPQRRLAKSLPRSIFSDPLTGRVLDFSNPKTRTALVNSAAMSLGQRPAPPSLAPGVLKTERYHKTRLRSELYDPITGAKVALKVSRAPIESLGMQERQVLPLAMSMQPAKLRTDDTIATKESIAASRRRKADSLAYVNPYEISS